jgi:ubiquinone/menaquinone biosynthesis C-methylase UbiE
MSDYYFRADQADELRRLTAIEVYADPASKSLLLELGVGPGWNCWEVGAGAGSMVYWLAERAGPDGRVLATDLDTGGLESHSNVEILRHDVVNDDLPETRFDLIHARFLLEHLPKPEHVLRRLTSALLPGGLLVIEDADGPNLTMEPGISGLPEVCQAWERAAWSISWNPTLGRYLMTALRECDLKGDPRSLLSKNGTRGSYMGGHEARSNPVT